MNRLVLILILNLCTISLISAAEPYYHKVTAKKGDGVFSLLRRYKLVEEPCNILQFYKLNKLDKNAKLLAGNKYFIPVLIYRYNGTSIRSTIGNDDWDKAVGIQDYNEYLLRNNLRKSSYRQSKILWVPFSSVYCGENKDKPVNSDVNGTEPINNTIAEKVADHLTASIDEEVQQEAAQRKTEPIPAKKVSSASKMKNDPLFGTVLGNYEEVDQSLKDKVFYLVSGHGGPDPGAMCTTCPTSMCEDEYAYDVVLRLARNLKQHGAQVEVIIQDKNDGIRSEKYLKCDKDERCNGKTLPLKQRKRLQQRVDHINTLHASYKRKGYIDHTVVAIHVDAAGETARKDVFFYHHKNSKTGKKLANNIHQTFKKKYDRFQKGRGYKGTVRSRGLFMVNHTNPPIVYIELANIKNPKDQQRILLDTNRQALANWIFLGLIQ